MATVDLTMDTFRDTVEGNETVFIDFWAAWCGPCRMFAPVYDQVSAEHPDVVFAKVDTEAQQALAANFNIQAIPTLMAIRDGVVLYSQAGALGKNALEDLVSKVLEVDMDDVRATIAATQGDTAEA